MDNEHELKIKKLKILYGLKLLAEKNLNVPKEKVEYINNKDTMYIKKTNVYENHIPQNKKINITMSGGKKVYNISSSDEDYSMNEKTTKKKSKKKKKK